MAENIDVTKTSVIERDLSIEPSTGSYFTDYADYINKSQRRNELYLPFLAIGYKEEASLEGKQQLFRRESDRVFTLIESGMTMEIAPNQLSSEFLSHVGTTMEPIFVPMSDNRFSIDSALKPIGSGEFGEVKIGFDHKHARKVAIKILSGSEESASFLEDRLLFSREARGLAKLTHPNVIEVIDYTVLPRLRGGKLELCPVIIMDYGGNKNAAEFMESAEVSGHKSQQLVQEIISQAARGLDYIHSYQPKNSNSTVKHGQLVVGDIKPKNIMVDNSTGEIVVQIIDLGHFHGRLSVDEPLLAAEDIAVSELFVAPEIMALKYQEAEITIDGRADEYSLALTAYQLLTGIKENYTYFIPAIGPKNRHFEGQILIPHASLTKELYQVLNKATALNPTDRYSSCGEFADALAEAVKASQEPHLEKQFSVQSSNLEEVVKKFYKTESRTFPEIEYIQTSANNEAHSSIPTINSLDDIRKSFARLSDSYGPIYIDGYWTSISPTDRGVSLYRTDDKLAAQEWSEQNLHRMFQGIVKGLESGINCDELINTGLSYFRQSLMNCFPQSALDGAMEQLGIEVVDGDVMRIENLPLTEVIKLWEKMLSLHAVDKKILNNGTNNILAELKNILARFGGPESDHKHRESNISGIHWNMEAEAGKCEYFTSDMLVP